MRFVHKKLPKSPIILHILSPRRATELNSGCATATLVNGKSDHANSTNPQIYGITCIYGPCCLAPRQADPAAMRKG